MLDSEILYKTVDSYLQNYYKISLKELNSWFGNNLCNYVTSLNEERYTFLDVELSKNVERYSNEFYSGKYKFDTINFQPNDVVIDIGASIGMSSIYLAKRFPFIKIYAFEPNRLNYNNLLTNITTNNVEPGIITAENIAVTGDGRDISLLFNPQNTGDCKIGHVTEQGYILKPEDIDIKSMTLEAILDKYEIDKIKLLKMDCCGAELEILKSCSIKTLRKIENGQIRFYKNRSQEQNKEINELITICHSYIKKIHFTESH